MTSVNTYLFELGCEEIPARFMPDLIEGIRVLADAQLRKLGISGLPLQVFASYRRLAFILNDVHLLPPEVEWKKGPKVSAGRSETGEFLPAAIGFAKRFGMTADQLEIRDDEQGAACFYAKIDPETKELKQSLSEAVIAVFAQLKCPILMSWGEAEHQFIRPVHWLVSLLNDDVVPVSLFGQRADRITYGHRMLGPNATVPDSLSGTPISLQFADQYLQKLEENFVQVDQVAREAAITSQLDEFGFNQAPQSTQLGPLYSEVAYLCEWPIVLEGKFDPEFLALPDDVLEEYMIKHQKYFPVLKEGIVDNRFLFVADGVHEGNREQVIRGNESVLRARLSDATFFYKEDLKTPLIDFYPKLATVVFQKNMGSILDKAARVASLSKWLNESLEWGIHTDKIDRASKLAKADLVTAMVGEFPSLQGRMGQHYAHFSKIQEDPDVANSIYEHYCPRYAGDVLPLDSSRLGVVLGIADRVDTIAACALNALLPTGSSDAWAVRRLCNGLWKLMAHFDVAIDLTGLFDYALGQMPVKDLAVRDALYVFLKNRLKQWLLDSGKSYDVLDFSESDLFSRLTWALQTIDFIQALKDASDSGILALTESAVRVGRIVKSASYGAIDPQQFTEQVEKDLYQAFQVAKEIVFQSEGAKDKYQALIPVLPTLVAYFDSVFIMHDDLKIRENRLAQLAAIGQLFRQIGDFEKLVF